MKKIFLITIFIIFFALHAQSVVASTPKILINVVQERGDETSSSLIKETEMLIARNLLRQDFEVMTSDDISPMSGLSRQEVESARSGAMSELRKAAVLNNAAFVVSAKVRTQVSQEEVLNMQMSRAATSASYRIVNAATGRTIDMDSLSFTTASRSGQEASHSNYQKLSQEIAQIASRKLPSSLTAQDRSQLSTYKSSLTPRPAPRPAPRPEPSAQQPEPADTQPTQAAALQPQSAEQQEEAAQAQPAGTNGPELVILNPPATRGFIPVARQRELTIEGMAIDSRGITEVRINGEKVEHDNDGRFQHSVELGSGENRFLIMAVNTVGRMSTKDLAVDRGSDTSPPELVLLRPEVTRGFQIAMRPEIKSTIIEGIVRDESDILFVRVNDQDVPFSDTGHFMHELALDDSTSTISIQAADIHGNITRKALEIARGESGWAAASSGSLGPVSPSGKPVFWGLAIGVSKYTSSSISLRYADQDALKLERFFKAHEGKSFSEVHFKTLVNEDVTRNAIIEAITTHLGKAAPNDIIFIFMAGHGIKHRQSGSYYFMPSDSDFNNLLSTGLRMSDFEESIRILSHNVDKIIVAMDTCHAGALQVGMRNLGTGEDLAGAISAASGTYILSASKAGEVSLESDKFRLDPDFTGHGAFTYALVNAMRGEADYDRDGYVSLNEVFQFVSRQVPRLTNGQQHPYFRMQGTDLPLVRLQ
ncbi:caspase family protein [Desulfonatronovibrio magnus]|uniref:caspase family protein n=1 Tax=Desulfonatronovibrio magnus TaxID=698827 RepID=UPI0005EBE7A5|nr:caspase family protein [Desulfonatronovibrio magnus]